MIEAPQVGTVFMAGKLTRQDWQNEEPDAGRQQYQLCHRRSRPTRHRERYDSGATRDTTGLGRLARSS